MALLYGYRYPDVIKRSVMIGVNPPGHFIWWPEMTEKIIKSYDRLYNLQNPADTLSNKKSIRIALENMPEKWSFFKLDADKIKATTFILLYRKQSAVMVFDAYRKAALKKDYSGLYLMQLAYDYILPGMFFWGDLFYKGACVDFNSARNYKQEMYSENSEIGAPLSLLIWGSIKNWPVKTIDEVYRKVKTSEIETLLIGGNLDISTPPEYASKELLPYLIHGKQVILEDMAHVDDVMGLQKDAFSNLITGYFNEGKIDTTLYKHDFVNFKPRVSFNFLTKILYPVVALLSIF